MTDLQVSRLIEEFHVPLHVRRHCAAVANFAVRLGEKFLAAGETINLTLLRHAALLHDLVRVVDFREFHPAGKPKGLLSKYRFASAKQPFNSAPASAEDVAFWEALREKYRGLHHAEAGARILEERGFPEVARLVRKHAFLKIREGFHSWEEKILYYADKRTKHNQIVSLKERLEEGRRRNAPETENTEEARELDKKVFALEREIFMKIGQVD